MKAYNIFLLLFLICFISCHSKRNDTSKEKIAQNIFESKKENFEEFSKLFYSDSSFQVSRINFPLSGKYNIAVTTSSSNELGDSIIYEWNKDKWVMLKNTSFKGNDSILNIDGEIYKRKIIKSDTLVIDSVSVEDSGFEIVKKFSLKATNWYLIYYSVMNY